MRKIFAVITMMLALTTVTTAAFAEETWTAEIAWTEEVTFQVFYDELASRFEETDFNEDEMRAALAEDDTYTFHVTKFATMANPAECYSDSTTATFTVTSESILMTATEPLI